MNFPWSFANALVWGWPEQPVFVDGRFEAYPRPFLIESLDSLRDDAALGRLLARYRPSWIFAQHCAPAFRARLRSLVAGGRWVASYADAQAVVLVGRETEYANRHPFSPPADPAGLLPAPPARRARQRLCYAQLLALLGDHPRSAAQLASARSDAGSHPDAELRAELDGAEAP